MLRALVPMSLILCGSATWADGPPTTGVYTSLQQPNVIVKTVTPPQHLFVPGMVYSNCCCGTVSFIPGVVVTTPAITRHYDVPTQNASGWGT